MVVLLRMTAQSTFELSFAKKLTKDNFEKT